MSWKELFEEIRESCDKPLWSAAVKLSRLDSVTCDKVSDSEIDLRVLDRSTGIAANVSLINDDCDWTKDCDCPDDPCIHVAAAAIQFNLSREKGIALPRSKTASAEILYEFAANDNRLDLKRWRQQGEQRSLLAETLTTQGSINRNLNLAPEKIDIAIDLVLKSSKSEAIKSAQIARYLSELPSRKVSFEGNPLSIDPKPLDFEILVSDVGPQIRLVGRFPEVYKKIYKNYWAKMTDGSLRPVSEVPVSRHELERLKTGILFGKQEFEKLASEVIPYYTRKFKIANHSSQLPRFVEEKPYLHLQMKRHGDRLTATPYIYYGKPVVAKVRPGSFEVLGDEIPARDYTRERELQDKLSRELKLDFNKSCDFDSASAREFIRKLDRWSGSYAGIREHDFRVKATLVPRLEIRANNFDLSFLQSSDENELSEQSASHDKKHSLVSSKAVLQAWAAGDQLVALNDGSFAPLPHDWLKLYGKQLRELMDARKEGEKVLPRAALPALGQLCEDLGEELPVSLKSWQEMLHGLTNLPDYSRPPDLLAELRDYQKDGTNWLAFLARHQAGALLADDMGLGKTLQTITVLEGKCLIVAPTSVLPNWQKEINKFRPSLKVCYYHGNDRRLDYESDVVLTSYGLLRLEQELLKSREWDFVVLDEAQNIKNPDSQVAKVSFKIKSKMRLALTGTPLENSLEDLWSQFNFLNPGLLGSRQYYRNEYIKPIIDGNDKIAKQLQQKIKPFFLRRLKKEVAKELPPKTEQVLYVELSEEERKRYESIKLLAKQEVINKLQAGNMMQALEQLLRLRQACCHQSLLPQSESQELEKDLEKGSAKLDLLTDTLKSALAEGHKALVFSQWTSFLDIIGRRLENEKINYLRLDGSTQDRASIVTSFDQKDGPPVLIMSLKAGGVGLNLTAADHVFIMDPWWNPATEEQAADRAYRIGQTNPVMVHPIVALGTVEEQILALQQAKKELAEAAVGGTARKLTITKDEILKLLD